MSISIDSLEDSVEKHLNQAILSLPSGIADLTKKKISKEEGGGSVLAISPRRVTAANISFQVSNDSPLITVMIGRTVCTEIVVNQNNNLHMAELDSLLHATLKGHVYEAAWRIRKKTIGTIGLLLVNGKRFKVISGFPFRVPLTGMRVIRYHYTRY